MNRTPRFVFIHGSPGRASDFDSLCAALSKGTNFEFGYLARNRYPLDPAKRSETLEPSQLESSDWLIGYSWGALEAVALTSSNVAGLVLIAPYVVVEKPLSPTAKKLLTLPVISDLMLTILRPKIERGFVVKTYAPETPTDSYKTDVNSSMTVRALRAAALEKDLVRTEIAQALSPNNSAQRTNLPCLILAGANDIVAPPEIHVSALKSTFPNARIETLEGKGHALIWSAPDSLARSIQAFVTSSAISQEVQK